MPFFKAGAKLVYYAHVPKCGGSAVEHFIEGRAGQMAFVDQKYMSVEDGQRWSKTSPQHINVEALERIIPASFFDASFAIVRHPVARVVSAYHFQLEQEARISKNVSFSDWLEDLELAHEENPYAYDNHLRPMDDIVPKGAHIFYLEHGLDALVPWFDALLGNTSAPRAVHKVNERSSGGEKVTPSPSDLVQIERIYARDFERFGYTSAEKMPKAPAPVLSSEIIAARDAELRAAGSPMAKVGKLAGKIRNKIAR